jgi:dTDP-4-amino-4,6-dideoxygalactose transaminase
MNVPFLDLGAAYRELHEEIDAAVARVFASGCYLLGLELERFEHEFAAYTGAAHCIGVGNGLEALILSLVAVDIQPGDEVIVPSNTFIATWLAVSHAGARPIPVEPDPRTYNLDPQRLEAAITPRTRAVMPVHLYGQPADLEAITAVARRHGLRVIVDAAQAHGAIARGRRADHGADATAWSFYPSKNLGAAGDGGAVTTGDVALAQRLRSLRNYGSTTKSVHDRLGFNSRLDEVQAAVLAVKLAHLDEWNERRRRVAAIYCDRLAGLGLTLPHVPPWASPVWHLFVVQHDHRDALRAALARRGIDTLVHYPVPPHLQSAYTHLGIDAGTLPIAEAIHQRVLSLPIGPHQSAEETERVVDAAIAAAADLSPSTGPSDSRSVTG